MSDQEKPIVPPETTSSEGENKPAPIVPPADDPKEIARRRSREDLERKRNTSRKSHGKH